MIQMNITNFIWMIIAFNCMAISQGIYFDNLSVMDGFMSETDHAECQDYHGTCTRDDEEDNFSEDKYPNRNLCSKPQPMLRKHISLPTFNRPSNTTGYKVCRICVKDNTIRVTMRRRLPYSFPREIQNARVIVYHYPNSIEIKIIDELYVRYSSLYPKLSPEDSRTVDLRAYVVDIGPDGLLTVNRRGTNVTIFQTDLTQLEFADQFLQIAARIPSNTVYGLPQQAQPLLKSMNCTHYTLFNRGDDPKRDRNTFGSHPFLIAIEEGGNATGIAFVNSDPMDVLMKNRTVMFRALGGIVHLLVFPGLACPGRITAPVDVVRGLSRWIGLPELPPYWGLGFGLGRRRQGCLSTAAAVIHRNQLAGVPVETLWGDLDFLHAANDFTYDPYNYVGLPNYIENLHSMGMHFVIIVDPGISNAETPSMYPPYDEGLQQNVFIRNETCGILVSKARTHSNAVFTDFTHPNATDYWCKLIQDFKQIVDFDGLWLDMNEPYTEYNGSVDGCPDWSSFDNNLPYVPGPTRPLYNRTLCMGAIQFASHHLDLHNIYGISQSHITNMALRKDGKRPFLTSRSTFLGQGRYSGHHYSHILSSWESMRNSIPMMLSMSICGVPLVGADICGYHNDTEEELCARWSALGAFYPLARNHNDGGTRDQDPAAMGSVVIEAAKNALLDRYYILPYLYSLFVKSHLEGDPVARPVSFEFPEDSRTHDIDTYFFLGPALMVIPALEKNQTNVSVYIPGGRWYDFRNLTLKVDKPGVRNYRIPLDRIHLAIRGGCILPCQTANLTVADSRKNPFHLLVALDEDLKASGELYWDDGKTLDTYSNPFGEWNQFEFEASKDRLTVKIHRSTYISCPMMLEKVYVLGLPCQPKDVELNRHKVQYVFNNKKKLLEITTSLDLLKGKIKFKWSGMDCSGEETTTITTTTATTTPEDSDEEEEEEETTEETTTEPPETTILTTCPVTQPTKSLTAKEVTSTLKYCMVSETEMQEAPTEEEDVRSNVTMGNLGTRWCTDDDDNTSYLEDSSQLEKFTKKGVASAIDLDIIFQKPISLNLVQTTPLSDTKINNRKQAVKPPKCSLVSEKLDFIKSDKLTISKLLNAETSLERDHDIFEIPQPPKLEPINILDFPNQKKIKLFLEAKSLSTTGPRERSTLGNTVSHQSSQFLRAPKKHHSSKFWKHKKLRG